jgi:hypothetical protein
MEHPKNISWVCKYQKNDSLKCTNLEGFSNAEIKQTKSQVKSEVKSDVKSQVKSEVKSQVKSEVKSSNLIARSRSTSRSRRDKINTLRQIKSLTKLVKNIKDHIMKNDHLLKLLEEL